MVSSWKLHASAAAVAIVLMSLLVLRVSAAAFTAPTDNPANNWATGSIALSDDDGGGAASALFNVTGMVPGQTESRCITVTYTGDVDPTAVKLYTSVTDGGLGPHLDVTVREADESGGVGSTCGTLSNAAVIVNNQTLNALATAHPNYTNGAGVWNPTATGQAKTYQFSVTLGADTPASGQGADAQATFTWETTT